MKVRRSEDPRNYVLVEELSSEVKPRGRGSRKAERRVLADEENVCDIWDPIIAKLTLMERDSVHEVCTKVSQMGRY